MAPRWVKFWADYMGVSVSEYLDLYEAETTHQADQGDQGPEYLLDWAWPDDEPPSWAELRRLAEKSQEALDREEEAWPDDEPQKALDRDDE